MQPRKVPIQSNDVPFNLYAKRSIEHIVILIDRIHSTVSGTLAIRLYAFSANFGTRIESKQDLSSSPFAVLSIYLPFSSTISNVSLEGASLFSHFPGSSRPLVRGEVAAACRLTLQCRACRCIFRFDTFVKKINKYING